MNTDLFNVMNQQQQQLAATVQRFNQLAVTNVEKLVALQLDTLRRYSDLGVAQLKALVEVRNPQQLQDYVREQGEVARRFGETLVADGKAVAELGVEYNQQAQQLARESVEAAVQPVAEEVKKPASKSAKQAA
ncbi:MAG: phasin family protein [Candidatus Competibacterales bacterium]|nr:phasin family protein [Candidatus Competibacterales bacterium]